MYTFLGMNNNDNLYIMDSTPDSHQCSSLLLLSGEISYSKRGTDVTVEANFTVTAIFTVTAKEG